jgi:hypothetical protein
LVYCHAGCSVQAITAAIELTVADLFDDSYAHWRAPTNHIRRSSDLVHQKEDVTATPRMDAARRIFDESGDLADTLGAVYLETRCLHVPETEALRFHAGLWHGQTGTTWPAIVALVSDGITGAPLGIHRTYLARDGGGKAPVTPNKMMLGRCRGGAVWLAEPREVLMVGEGIETVLSAMQATGIPAWAALSTSGLRCLNLPPCVREVIVLADADKAGEAAASAFALRWTRQGLRVRIARPPAKDFNEVLTGGRRDSAVAVTP